MDVIEEKVEHAKKVELELVETEGDVNMMVEGEAFEVGFFLLCDSTWNLIFDLPFHYNV